MNSGVIMRAFFLVMLALSIAPLVYLVSHALANGANEDVNHQGPVIYGTVPQTPATH
jgi:hypothetical protein